MKNISGTERREKGTVCPKIVHLVWLYYGGPELALFDPARKTLHLA